MDSKKFIQLVEEKKKRVLERREAPLKWEQKLEAAAKPKADADANERKLYATKRQKSTPTEGSESESSGTVRRSRKQVHHKRGKKHHHKRSSSISDYEKHEKRSGKHRNHRRCNSSSSSDDSSEDHEISSDYDQLKRHHARHHRRSSSSSDDERQARKSGRHSKHRRYTSSTSNDASSEEHGHSSELNRRRKQHGHRHHGRKKQPHASKRTDDSFSSFSNFSLSDEDKAKLFKRKRCHHYNRHCDPGYGNGTKPTNNTYELDDHNPHRKHQKKCHYHHRHHHHHHRKQDDRCHLLEKDKHFDKPDEDHKQHRELSDKLPSNYEVIGGNEEACFVNC